MKYIPVIDLTLSCRMAVILCIFRSRDGYHVSFSFDIALLCQHRNYISANIALLFELYHLRLRIYRTLCLGNNHLGSALRYNYQVRLSEDSYSDNVGER